MTRGVSVTKASIQDPITHRGIATKGAEMVHILLLLLLITTQTLYRHSLLHKCLNGEIASIRSFSLLIESDRLVQFGL